MQFENEKIVAATEDELYRRWLNGGWCNFVVFRDYLAYLEMNGVEIKRNEAQT